jgi:hypothetical protein
MNIKINFVEGGERAMLVILFLSVMILFALNCVLMAREWFINWKRASGDDKEEHMEGGERGSASWCSRWRLSIRRDNNPGIGADGGVDRE